jgi:hypothetical protein
VCVCALAFAAAAHANSIVFIKDGDVWLARGDGSGQRAITKNGTDVKPYRSPAYSDTGVISAVRGRRDIHFFNRRGKRLRKKRDISGGPTPPFDAVIIDHSISPNGKTLASTLWISARSSDPPSEPAGEDLDTSVWYTKTKNGKMAVDGTTDGGKNVTWASNRVPIVFAPYVFKSADAWVVDLAGDPNDPRQWFQDQANPEPGSFTDGEPLDDGELTRQRDKIAVVRGPNTTASSAPTMLRVYGMTNLVDRPTERCDLRSAPNTRVESPSWSPDGAQLAWSEADGIWVSPIAGGAGDCAAAPRQLIAGGSQPDWGPANVPRRR